MVKKRRKSYKSKKNANNKNIFIIRRVIAFLLLLGIFAGIKYILSSNKEFITSESINFYIDQVDEMSKDLLQLNWKEVAAIDGVDNTDFASSSGKKIQDIVDLFYVKNGEQYEIRSFDDVLEKSGFKDSEKKKAKRNLDKLQGVSLRAKKEGENKSKDEFIASIKGSSISNYKKYGILPSVTISQAILESNWGKSELSAKYNNYFGIKANSAWKGKIVNFSTKENYNDTIKANFRAYDSMDESVNDFGNFLNVNGRYRKNGLFDGKNYIEQTQALEDAGYSTKKNEDGEAIYADLLKVLIRDNNLMIIDNEAARS